MSSKKKNNKDDKDNNTTSDIETSSIGFEETPELAVAKDKTTLDELMKINYSYPAPNDPEIQSELYGKREFYYNRIPERPDVGDYNDIKEYRDNMCGRSFTLQEHQALLSNFINPDTPYKGLLIFHGTGTGK